MNETEFFEAVASLLNVENTFETQMPYRRRWGQRMPGNGRYIGYGVIRWYSPNLIHVMSQAVTQTFYSPEETLDCLKVKWGG